MELTKKEAVILLDNNPARADASKYQSKEVAEMEDDQKIEFLKNSLKLWKTSKELHFGLHHKGRYKPLPFPEKLLVILFLHRYAVTDQASLHNLQKLVSSDFVPVKEQFRPNYTFYTPEWLGRHAVTNIVEVVRNTVGMELSGPIQTRILDTAAYTTPRLRMAVLHTTTKSFVKILVKYGGNPKLPDNAELSTFRHHLERKRDEGQPTTATAVILDALPYVLQFQKRYVSLVCEGLPIKDCCMSDKWITGTTLDDFNIYIPAEVPVGASIVRTGVSITDYFDGVFNGTISFDTMINCVTEHEPVQPPESPKKSPSSKGGGGGGGGGASKTKSDESDKTELNVKEIKRQLSSIEAAARDIPKDSVDKSVKKSITDATKRIRTLISGK